MLFEIGILSGNARSGAKLYYSLSKFCQTFLVGSPRTVTSSLRLSWTSRLRLENLKFSFNLKVSKVKRLSPTLYHIWITLESKILLPFAVGSLLLLFTIGAYQDALYRSLWSWPKDLEVFWALRMLLVQLLGSNKFNKVVKDLKLSPASRVFNGTNANILCIGIWFQFSIL